VAGTEAVLDVTVILRPLVDILDQQPDRSARGQALEHAGEDAYLVRLAALGGVARLPGAAPVKVALQILLAQRKTRRAAVDNGSQRLAMALAESGDDE